MINKIYISTLGCSKNLVDSETMLSILNHQGLERVDDPKQADLAIVNTCGFIEAAKQESIQEILELAEYKKHAKMRYLIVTGCLAQRYQKELAREMPEVDAFLGTTSFEKIYEVVEGLQSGYRKSIIWDIHYPVDMNAKRERLTPRYTAFIKIAEGCDNRCTYCIIPRLRGNYRSREMSAILEEAKSLADQGVKEIILIAQDTAKYGMDLYGQKSLAKLLRQLNEIENLHWIRFLYTYPEDIDEELVEAVRMSEKVCSYFDMPIQHCCDQILRRMNRKTTQRQLYEKIQLIRKQIPDAVIRTTLITGFPGESEEEFRQMKAFVSEIGFERLGVFAYSQEEDTPAAKMPDQIAAEIKERRRDELMQMQQNISRNNNRRMLGLSMEVLIEKEIEEGLYEGRSRRDAPEIDGVIFVHAKKKHEIGDFVQVSIRDFLEYDLIGDEMDEYGEQTDSIQDSDGSGVLCGSSL